MAARPKRPGHMLNMNMGAINSTFEKASPEEKAAFAAKYREFGAQNGLIDVEPQVTMSEPVGETEAAPVTFEEAASSIPAPEPQAASDERPKFHDFQQLRERLDAAKVRLEKNMDRGVDVFNAAVRVLEIDEAIERSLEAERIPQITRRYGCRNQREMLTLEGYRPDAPIIFTRYEYVTSDPMEIAYIEHRRRMRVEANEHPSNENAHWRSSAEIQDIGEMIALVNWRYRSDFAGFYTEQQAVDMEKSQLAIAARRVRA